MKGRRKSLGFPFEKSITREAGRIMWGKEEGIADVQP